jgi:outer membrane protein assembly factor BamB
MKNMNSKLSVALITAMLLPLSGRAADWPRWGRDAQRNMYSPAKNLPSSFDVGEYKQGTEEVDMASTKNIRWVAKLGSSSYGNVTVKGGKVFVGTNNETPRDEKIQGDYSMVYCFDEKTGEYLWQLAVPKLGAGKVSDWEFLGICSSPDVDGDRVYIVTSRCEVMCLDVAGQANGNQGYQDEGKYIAGPGAPPVEVGPKDADIIWVYDMREELGVFPHNVASSSVLIHGDRLYATTSNGQDWSHLNIPAPLAPSLICLDKNTGKYLGEEGSGISERLMHCNWSSPAIGKVNGEDAVIFGAGDGFLYAFNPVPVPLEDDPEIKILPELWRYNAVPERYFEKKYPHPEGPSEIIATPVIYKGRAYVGIGQDPEHGEGVGNLVCVDLDQKGSVPRDKARWMNDKINRTISTVSIDPDTNLLIQPDYSGFVHCLDANTGEQYWRYDMKSHIWGSALVADGKIYVCDEDGDLVILPAKKDFDPANDEPLFETMFPGPIYSSPIEANGVIYVGTMTHLYAIGNPE